MGKDKLWKVLVYGTKEEIDEYKIGKTDEEIIADSAKASRFLSAETVLPGIAGLAMGFAGVAAGIPFALDSMCRGGNWAYNSVKGLKFADITYQPGLIGTIRTARKMYNDRKEE